MCDYPKPIVTVDTVVLTLADGGLNVVLVRRDKEPFPGAQALPGGFVRIGEDRDAGAAARRILAEKAGIATGFLEQLYTFSGPVRDPRGWSVSIAHYFLVRREDLPAEDRFALVPIDRLPELPFDHRAIIAKAVERVRSKASYTTLPIHLMPETFTLEELRACYEAVLGRPLDRSSFRQKMLASGFVVLALGERKGQHRPAQLYRAASPIGDFGRVIG